MMADPCKTPVAAVHDLRIPSLFKYLAAVIDRHYKVKSEFFTVLD